MYTTKKILISYSKSSWIKHALKTKPSDWLPFIEIIPWSRNGFTVWPKSYSYKFIHLIGIDSSLSLNEIMNFTWDYFTMTYESDMSGDGEYFTHHWWNKFHYKMNQNNLLFIRLYGTIGMLCWIVKSRWHLKCYYYNCYVYLVNVSILMCTGKTSLEKSTEYYYHYYFFRHRNDFNAIAVRFEKMLPVLVLALVLNKFYKIRQLK